MGQMIATLAVILAQVASPQCAPRDVILPKIEGGKYEEGRIGAGLSETGLTIMEFFYNENSGTWTLLGTRNVAGIRFSCVIASGTDWRLTNDPAGEDL